MTAKHGSVLGGMLLITGSCIGAGMLALPILTGLAGFFPTLLMFFLAWGFMTTTALLLVEVNGWHKKPVNLLTMVGETLGKTGRYLSWVLYLLLFYSLLVAYMTLSGNHVHSFADHLLGMHIPDYAGTLFFVLLFGWLIFLGTRAVDYLNRLLMVGKIVAFLLLVFIGVRYMQPDLLLQNNLSLAFFSLPVLIISFGFHNMIPTLTNYMKGDTARVKKAILAGSIFTLVLYLLWEILILGILSGGEILSAFKDDIDAAQALKNLLKAPSLGFTAQALAFFAVLTSLLAQSLGLSHFIADGLKISHGDRRENPWTALLALLPPLIFTMLFPQLFFEAINFAGGICAVILFGIFPVMMVWIGRYRDKKEGSYRHFAGKVSLSLIFLFALFIFFYQLSQMLGLQIFARPG
ncbi:MAG: aromatic amino acid transport family protein [Chlamydiales bacterium]